MKVTETLRISRSVAEKLPSLSISAQKGLLVMHPYDNDILRAIIFESSGSATKFYTWAFLMALYPSQDDLALNMGIRLRTREGRQDWSIDNARICDDLVVAIEEQAMPLFQEARDLQSFIGFVERAFIKAYPNPYVLLAIACCYARLGNRDAAIRTIDECENRLDPTSKWNEAVRNPASQLRQVLLDDPERVQNLLVNWKAETMSNLGLGSQYKAARKAKKRAGRNDTDTV